MTVPGSIPKIILLFWTNWVYFWVQGNKLNKSIKIFTNYFIGPLLFVWLVYRVYNEINAQKDLPFYIEELFKGINAQKIAILILVIFLMLVQWMAEAKKWQLLLQGILFVPFGKAVKSIFSGIAFSISTPNRFGEFIGRILHLPKEARLQGTTCTFIGNFAQLIATCFAGAIGLVFTQSDQLLNNKSVFGTFISSIKIAAPITFLFFVFIYFQAAIFFKWLSKFKFLEKWKNNLIGLSEIPFYILLKVLAWSFLRYAIFMVQYWLFFQLLDVHIGFLETCMGLSVMLLWLAVIPTVSIVELGLRWQFSIFLLSPFSSNALGLTMAVTFVWLLNLMLPALVGAFLLFRVGKQEERLDG